MNHKTVLRYQIEILEIPPYYYPRQWLTFTDNLISLTDAKELSQMLTIKNRIVTRTHDGKKLVLPLKLDRIANPL